MNLLSASPRGLYASSSLPSVRTRTLQRSALIIAVIVQALLVRLEPVHSFSAAVPNSKNTPNLRRSGGGRAPQAPDIISTQQDDIYSQENASEARLIVLQITDVYTLEYFAHFKTLLEETRRNNADATVVCMLTGDFLSPYLLSGVDRGAGMMRALANVPMDYLTWGNHEADIPHKVLCRYVRNFPGKWLNSNMLDHEAMAWQHEYDVLEITSPDGTNKRKVGLVAALSDDPALYQHFEEPGAFGGATVTDPWEALRKYKDLLEGPEHNCDMVIPLQHLYVPDDHKTCRELDFPVILSGHDHHRVDEVVEGTRLLKPGMNAEYATLLQVSWEDAKAEKPTIRARFVKCDDWPADPVTAEINERAYDALAPLRNTELAKVPPMFEPLSSNGARQSVCTMGKFICTLLRTSLNVSRSERKHQVDAVLLMGGNIRGNQDYPEGTYFSAEALEAEIKADEVVAVIPMPGWLLAEGVSATHAGDPIPGWMQYDQGVVEDTSVQPPVVTHVAGKPIEPDRIYRVATKISDLTNGQSPPWTEYYTQHPQLLPPKGAYVNIQSELMGHFARGLWNLIWDAISEEVEDNCEQKLCDPKQRLEKLDTTGNGIVTVEEIQVALRDRLGLSIDRREQTLAHFVHSYADTTGDGKVTLADLKVFCNEIAESDERDRLRLINELSSAPSNTDESPREVVDVNATVL